jgi:hypothetical protein
MANSHPGWRSPGNLTARRQPTILFPPGGAAAQVADDVRFEGGKHMTIVKHSIDAEMAEKAVAAAATKATELKLKMCIREQTVSKFHFYC